MARQFKEGGLASNKTLRQWYAGEAMKALIQEALRQDHVSWDATAAHAFIIADAMLAAEH